MERSSQCRHPVRLSQFIHPYALVTDVNNLHRTGLPRAVADPDGSSSSEEEEEDREDEDSNGVYIFIPA